VVNKKAPWWPMSASTAPSGRMFFFFNAAFLAIVAVCNLAYDLVGQSVLFLPLAGPLLAQSGHSRAADQCPISGVERTSSFSIGDYAAPMHVGPVEDRSNSVRSPSCYRRPVADRVRQAGFSITGRGAGQRRDRQLRRSPLANAMSG
jgi:hypothetical protein